MLGKHATWTAIAALGVFVVGCQDTRFSGAALQNQKMAAARETPPTYLNDMVDNAILHDMSIADIHFVAHTNELSGTGVARLDRMGPLLDTYGGVLRYDTTATDEQLVQARIDHVREYLTVVGCDMDRVEIHAMMAGGRGMRATHALQADKRAYTQNDDGIQRSEQVITHINEGGS